MRYNSTYRGEHLNRSAFPLGDLGAGMIALEGTGAFSRVSLRDKLEAFNEPLMFAALQVNGAPGTGAAEPPGGVFETGHLSLAKRLQLYY